MPQLGFESGSGSRVTGMLLILKENIKIILEKKTFFTVHVIFKNKMSTKEIFSQLSH